MVYSLVTAIWNISLLSLGFFSCSQRYLDYYTTKWFIEFSGGQSQLVCSGCRNLLLYPLGATSVCCAVCSAVTAVPPPGTSPFILAATLNTESDKR